MGGEPILTMIGRQPQSRPSVPRRIQHTDLNYTGLQWLVSAKAADILSNALAVFLAIAAKRSFTIAKICILVIDGKYPD